MSFRYALVDIRNLNGDLLLESSEVGDNVIAILARLRDRHEAVRRILVRVVELTGDDQTIALKQLLTLAGLRDATSLEDLLK